MKIGNFEFKGYAAKKPISLSPDGEFLTVKDIAALPKTEMMEVGSLFTLDTDQQLKLALERYAHEPDFKLGIIGAGTLTKDEVIEHLKKQDDFGRMALQAEMGYCNELIAELVVGSVVPNWPDIPVTPPIVPPDWKPLKKCILLKMTNRAIFCENTTDGVTTPFAQYRKVNVHSVFTSRGFNVIVLENTNDVRANFIPEAKKPLSVYLSGIGHGAYTTYTGHWGDHILEVGNYDAAEVKDKTIHFLSCQTGRTLGPDTVSNGAKSYAGYVENFILQWDNPSTKAVNEFELFAKCDSTFDIMMANGATAQVAYDTTIQAFNAARGQVPNTVAATYLTLDRDRLKLSGNGTATIQPYRYVKICFPIMNPNLEDALANIGELED